VLDADDQQFRIAVVIMRGGGRRKMSRQAEGPARLEKAAIADTFEELRRRLELLHAQAALAVAVVSIGKAIGACILVMFYQRHGALLVQGRYLNILWPRRLEVVTGEARAGRLELAHRRPLGHAIFFDGASMMLEGDQACAVDRLGIARIIRQSQLMAVCLVFVVVVPASVFPAPMQEVAVALVELEHLGALCVAMAQQAVPSRMQRIGAEDFGTQSLQAEMMKDAIVPARGQEGHPRHQACLVEGDAAIGAYKAEAVHVAGEMARRAVCANQRHAQQLAHQRLQRDAGVVAEKFERVSVIAAQGLAGVEAIDQQFDVGGIVIDEVKLQDAVMLALPGQAVPAGGAGMHACPSAGKMNVPKKAGKTSASQIGKRRCCTMACLKSVELLR